MAIRSSAFKFTTFDLSYILLSSILISRLKSTLHIWEINKKSCPLLVSCNIVTDFLVIAVAWHSSCFCIVFRFVSQIVIASFAKATAESFGLSFHSNRRSGSSGLFSIRQLQSDFSFYCKFNCGCYCHDLNFFFEGLQSSVIVCQEKLSIKLNLKLTLNSTFWQNVHFFHSKLRLLKIFCLFREWELKPISKDTLQLTLQ